MVVTSSLLGTVPGSAKSSVPNLLATIDRTDAHSPSSTAWGDIPGFSTVESIAGTGSVVLLVALIPMRSINTTDRVMELRFTIDGSATGSPVVHGFADAVDETSGVKLTWAVDGLSTGNHTFAVQAQDLKASSAIDVRPRSFQIIEFLAAEATLLIDKSSGSTNSSGASWATMTDLSDTVTPASGSLLMFLFNATPDGATTGDKRAEYRFILDGTQDGPFGSAVIDNDGDEVHAVGMMWLETGHAASSQVIGVQHRTVSGDVVLDTGRLRTFQVIEYTGTFDLDTDLALTSAQDAPDPIADMTGMTGSITPTDTDTIVLWLGMGSVMNGANDSKANFRLHNGTALEGAELVEWSDNAILRTNFLLSRFKTGLSGAQTLSLQWLDNGGTLKTDNVRERSFQICSFDAGAGDQTLTPDLAQELVNTFDPAITTGPVSMTPGLAQELINTFDPVLTTTVTFTPGLEQQLAQGFDPVITTGPVTLLPDLLQQLAQGFDPTLTTTVEITPGLLQQLISTFDPVVTTGAVSILPALLQQLAQGIDPTITLFEQTLTPGLMQQLAQGIDPVVTTGAVTITPGLLQQLVQAFSTTVTPGPATLSPDLLQQLAQAFDPVLTAEFFITPSLQQQLVLTFDPTVSPGDVSILPALIQELVNTFDPTLTTVVTVSPGLANQSAVAYDPVVTLSTAQTITPGLAQQVTVSFDPTVTTGPVTISVGLAQRLVQAFGPVVGGDDQPDALTTMGDWSD